MTQVRDTVERSVVLRDGTTGTAVTRWPRRRTLLTVPNILTSARFLAAFVVAGLFVGSYAERAATVLALLAVSTDGVDGWYARKFSQRSRLGAFMDPLADKMIIGVIYGIIAVNMASPTIWLLYASIMTRDLVITFIRARRLRGVSDVIPSNRLGKIKMLVQSSVGVSVLTCVYVFGVPWTSLSAIVLAALVLIALLSHISALKYRLSMKKKSIRQTH